MISSIFAPSTTRVEDIGGKAASLFRLHSLGVAVPPFFALTSGAARDGVMTRDVRNAVQAAWSALGGDRYGYAVRSSSAAEDSSGHSFAGVFETILNVRGIDAVFAAIEKCLASHRSAIADSYRNHRAVTGDDGMAIIVQRMVRASWSGVCFTADPATQSLSRMAVNAVKGLGEDLVSGLVNPEEILLERHSGKLLSRRKPEGSDPFPDTMLQTVATECRKIADAFGFPQDIEWAFDGETLQILQSRPITTLTSVWHNRPLEPWADDPSADADNESKIWTRTYADEIWAPPVSPLFYDVQNLTGQIPLQLGNYGDKAPGPPDAIKYFRAAPYLDISLLERLFVFQPRLMRLQSLLYQLPPERRDAMARARWRWLGLVRRTWIFEVVHGNRFGFTRNHKFLKRSWAPFLAATNPLAAVKESELSDQKLEDHLTAIWTLAGTIGLECGITVFYYAQDLKLLLTALLARWFGQGEELYGTISAGLEDSHTVREADSIWQIAMLVQYAGPATVDLAKASDWKRFQAKAGTEALRSVRGAFDTFLSAHGHRGASYKDLIHPRWGDNSELLWQQVKAFLSGESPRPAETNSRSAATRVATQRDCLNQITGIYAPAKKWLLRKLFRYNEIYMSLRDNHRFYYDRIWWLLRRVYVEKGQRLFRRGLLQDPDDVFFLVRKEIGDLSRGSLPADQAAIRIAIRREEWIKTLKEQPPKFLRRGYVPDDEQVSAGTTGKRLVGLAASAGQVTGHARIIYDVSELARVGKGDILVTRQTDPSWTPAFARLSGLVLETGGVLAHGASLCREFNVPCVTVVERATRLIHDGDMITVNGGLGIVEIIESNDATAHAAA